MDLVSVLDIKAVVVDAAGKQLHTTPVSVDFGSFELETAATAAECARALCKKAKEKFRATVQAVTQAQSVLVNGLPDQQQMTVDEMFDLTVGRAVSMLVRSIRLSGKPDSVSVPGLRSKGTTAIVTCKVWSAESTSLSTKTRGPGACPLSMKVFFSINISLHHGQRAPDRTHAFEYEVYRTYSFKE
jgi:hypothetical protein